MQEEEHIAVQQGVELFREVYRKDMSEGTFWHKHFGNPSALPVPYIIEARDGVPLGMRWLMRMSFCFGDRRMAGVQSSDDAVSERARGLLFLKMRKKTLAILQQEGVEFEYGCFSEGAAMEIAEKTGEKCVVNLQMARLYLNESTHRWKRFDIAVPSLIKKPLAHKRKGRLEKLARKGLSVSIDKQLPFRNDDFACMNLDDSLHVERTEEYYKWKTSRMKDLYYVTAREGKRLCGYLVVKEEANKGMVVDWDVLRGDGTAILASMLVPLSTRYQYLDIPSLNVERGEMELFTKLGGKDMSRLWAHICICVKPLTDEVAAIVNNAANWKHRLIDTDYFLNGD